MCKECGVDHFEDAGGRHRCVDCAQPSSTWTTPLPRIKVQLQRFCRLARQTREFCQQCQQFAPLKLQQRLVDSSISSSSSSTSTLRYDCSRCHNCEHGAQTGSVGCGVEKKNDAPGQGMARSMPCSSSSSSCCSIPLPPQRSFRKLPCVVPTPHPLQHLGRYLALTCSSPFGPQRPGIFECVCLCFLVSGYRDGGKGKERERKGRKRRKNKYLFCGSYI